MYCERDGERHGLILYMKVSGLVSVDSAGQKIPPSFPHPPMNSYYELPNANENGSSVTYELHLHEVSVLLRVSCREIPPDTSSRLCRASGQI
jgi:hypothetical protein